MALLCHVYNKITEKITRFRNVIANKKRDALENAESGRYELPISYYACVKVDALGDLIFTISGSDDLVYLNPKTAELVHGIGGIMKSKPDKLVLFYSKSRRKSYDAKGIRITDKRSILDDYYDISVELYIYKLLSER